MFLVLQRARQFLVDFEIATNPKYIPNWHHDLIGKELEHIEIFKDRDYKILIVSVPPRHGKSQQCSIDFPAWYLGRNPDREIITASHTAELAQTFGGKTREKVSSEEYKLIFPETTLKEDEKARGRWRTNRGPITGYGANVFLIDDPVKNREEAESKVFQEKTWDWFISTAYTRLEPNGIVILITTRWNLNDLAGKILTHPELTERVKVIRLPAIAEEDEINRKKEEALWPERYPISVLKEIQQTLGPYEFSALYQGSPIMSSIQEFKNNWFKYRDENEVNSLSTRRFLTIDTALSKLSQADYTGFCDNAVDKENFWNLRAWRARLSPEELIQNIFSLYQNRQYEIVGIEKTAYLDGLKPYLDSEQRKRNIFLPIMELKHNQQSKEIRIRGLVPRYASGSVFHVRGQCSALEEEMVSFPVGIHDDVLDATAYQLQTAEKTNIKRLTIFKPQWKSFNRK